MYIVGQTYTNKDGVSNLMSETFHETLNSALEDHANRDSNGYRDLVIARVLTVKTVLVDYDASGANEVSLYIGGK